MSKNEITAKILKSKKRFFLLSQSHKKLISTHPGWGNSFKPNIQQINEALESDIGFWQSSWILLKKLKKAKKNYRANSLGPICILQIFGNNPISGSRVGAETKYGGGGGGGSGGGKGAQQKQ